MSCVLANGLYERGNVELDLSLTESYRFVVEKPAGGAREKDLGRVITIGTYGWVVVSSDIAIIIMLFSNRSF